MDIGENKVTEATPLIKHGHGDTDDGQHSVRKSGVPTASAGRKSVVMAACIVIQTVTFGVGYALPVLYVEFIRVFGVSRSEAALVQSIYMGIMVGGGVITTQLIKKYGPGACIIAGALVGCGALVVSSFAVNIQLLIVFAGVLAGFGNGMMYLSSFVTVSWMYHENPRLPLKLLTMGSGLGQLVFPYFAEVLISEYQWYGCLLVLSGVTLNCAIFGTLVYTSRRYLDTGDDEEDGGGAGGCRNMCNICNVSLLTDPMVLLFLVSAFLISLTGPIEGWFLVDIMVLRGYEREVGSALETVLGLANFIGRLIGVLLHLNRKVPTLLHWTYLCPILAVGHALFINMTAFWPTFGSLLLCGIAFGSTMAQAPAIMYEVAGKERYPKAIALMNLVYGFGNAFGGLMGGVIKDVTGSYDAMFYFAVGASAYISLATSGMGICLRRQKKKSSYETLTDDNQPHKNYHVTYTNEPVRNHDNNSLTA